VPTVARHSSERYSYVKILLAIGLLLEALGLEFGLARLLTTYLMELPNSRVQELEGTLSSPPSRVVVIDQNIIKRTKLACD
jgi:hypothetical protein